MVKRLFLDIETSYSVVATFSLYPKAIPHSSILSDWHIICAAWKWEGDKDIHGKLTYTKNDKQVVKALRKAILEADEIVYHNGKKFDYKKLNTRVLLNGLPPMSKPRETDTLIQCRKHFAFTSNRLDYVAKVLLDKGKLETKPGLWMEALQGNKQAIDQMFEYNKVDVEILEGVFQKLRPHIDLGHNPSIDNGMVCIKCSSHNIQKRGYSLTKTGKYARLVCKDCGAWSQSGTREKTDWRPLR